MMHDNHREMMLLDSNNYFKNTPEYHHDKQGSHYFYNYAINNSNYDINNHNYDHSNTSSSYTTSDNTVYSEYDMSAEQELYRDLAYLSNSSTTTEEDILGDGDIYDKIDIGLLLWWSYI